MPSDLRFGARGGIRTPPLSITSQMFRVDLDGSRRILPAHVGCAVDPDRSRRIQKDRLDDQGASDTASDGMLPAGGPVLWASTKSSSRAIDADLADVGPSQSLPTRESLLRLGPVVGVGGYDSRVNASRQALLGGDPAQQADQPMALGLGQTSAELRLVVCRHL